jgi:hypothetical protein
VLDQFEQIPDRKAHAGHQQHLLVRRLDDRREVARRVVGQFLPERHVVGLAGPIDQQRVAVAGRLGDDVRADASIGARTVVDQDRYAQRFRQAPRDHASEEVSAAAWRIRHDEPDRFGGPCLRRGWQRCQDRCAERPEREQRSGVFQANQPQDKPVGKSVFDHNVHCPPFSPASRISLPHLSCSRRTLAANSVGFITIVSTFCVA